MFSKNISEGTTCIIRVCITTSDKNIIIKSYINNNALLIMDARKNNEHD